MEIREGIDIEHIELVLFQMLVDRAAKEHSDRYRATATLCIEIVPAARDTDIMYPVLYKLLLHPGKLETKAVNFVFFG